MTVEGDRVMHPDAQALLDQLHADCRAGLLKRRSAEYERRRAQALSLDPTYRERKAAYQRAHLALRRGDPSLMEAYRAGLAVPHRRVIESDAERHLRRKREKQAKANTSRFRFEAEHKHMARALKSDAARIAAVVAMVQAEARCASTIQDRGWIIRCFYTAGHDGPCVHRRTA